MFDARLSAIQFGGSNGYHLGPYGRTVTQDRAILIDVLDSDLTSDKNQGLRTSVHPSVTA
jgi:hypothetical protein